MRKQRTLNLEGESVTIIINTKFYTGNLTGWTWTSKVNYSRRSFFLTKGFVMVIKSSEAFDFAIEKCKKELQSINEKYSS